MDNHKRGNFDGLKPGGQFIFSSVGVLIVGFVFQLIAMLLATVLFDVTIFDLGDYSDLDQPDLLSALKFVQILGGLGTFIFSSFLLSFLYSGSWTGYFSFKVRPDLFSVFLIIIVMVVALPFVNYLTEINQNLNIPFDRLEQSLRNMDETTERLMMALLEGKGMGALLINLFMVAIIPAIGEELVFRGLIQKHLLQALKNPHIAIFIAAVIFSAIHMQIFAFLPRFFLGLVLGYMFYYGKTIWYSIIAHFVNNAMGVVYYFIYAKESTGTTIDEIGTPGNMGYAAFASLAVVTFFLYMFVKQERSD